MKTARQTKYDHDDRNTIRVLGPGGDYEDWPNPNYKPSSELPSSTGSVTVFAENFTIVEVCEHMICILPRSGKGKGMVAVLTKEQAAKIATALVPKIIVPGIQPQNDEQAER